MIFKQDITNISYHDNQMGLKVNKVIAKSYVPLHLRSFPFLIFEEIRIQ